MKTLTLLTSLLLPAAASAAPLHFRDCRSEIVTEVFLSCPGGEGGSGTVCGSRKTLWGSAAVELTVDSEALHASGSLVYTPVKGAKITSALSCTLGEDHWMSCVTGKSVPELGRLSVDFNISGIAPGVYFTDVFADATNVPVGGFQTEQDCKR